MSEVNTSAVDTANEKRDHMLTASFLYGIACIQSLPEEQQERVTMLRMCAMARFIAGPKLALTLWSVETHIGREIDVWPADGGFGPGGSYTDEELDYKAAVRAEIRLRKELFERTGALSDAPPSDVIRFL
jgi:hypothetical protein